MIMYKTGIGPIPVLYLLSFMSYLLMSVVSAKV